MLMYSKGSNGRVMRRLQCGKRLFPSHTPDRGAPFRIYKELQELNNESLTHPVNKLATELGRRSSKRISING